MIAVCESRWLWYETKDPSLPPQENRSLSYSNVCFEHVGGIPVTPSRGASHRILAKAHHVINHIHTIVTTILLNTTHTFLNHACR
jgi:hypothetical protein